ncbi:MAG: ethanolamine ammonia-lyase subunit EutC [Alphaproteobacteria bacterium]|nr:ethanolamine ammonia-lyase subunit EutC [Alphaproteobacteria bacterium]MBU1279175.1 ethanolamine ammonia-lyase subunit EutC [Alphaproteobacteria bacterium]MBU1572561.1 ethanolamine ammonia-lyase subunit EutC [Alphaproteobacteria bacterium]MBU1830570.1 ethanolamine ammonia-lyase subunit EutC [Alphaproteobacteria bacterium]MBU2077559.1 ethanolamine ammonia-lyase subunit EutC [Alphaproteobacteria bacterium]
MSDIPSHDPWAKLRAATVARIGLGRSGAGLPTGAHLTFQYAHARARDAVQSALDVDALARDLAPQEVVRVASAAPDRATYLRRPDLGRRLASGEAETLNARAPCDVAFVIADGLSSAAVQAHAAAVVHACVPKMSGLSIGPVVIAAQARVAIGDEIGDLLGARLVVVLVGERPGLSVADSLGAYLTYDPRVGRRDSDRNCLSNIHAKGGMSPQEAARKIAWLTHVALTLGLTGTGLKEDSGQIETENAPRIGGA